MAPTAALKALEDRERLEKLPVKELRRQAALHDVPLTMISAAVEKPELINMILRAGPVKDSYDVGVGVKVHSATSIATAIRQKIEQPKQKKQKKEKKEKKRRETSSSSSRSSRSGGRRKKRSRSRSKGKADSRQMAVAAAAARRRAKKLQQGSRSRSPSLQMLTPAGGPPARRLRALPAAGKAAAAPKAKALKALPLPPIEADAGDDLEVVSTTPAAASAAPAAAKAGADKDASKPSAPPREKPKDIAQVGVLAAAKLGFKVLPKAPSQTQSPAPGLRPSINTSAAGMAPTPWGASQVNTRVCIQYLQCARCDLGGNCPDAHITDPEEEMIVRARFKEQMCNYGANCTRIGCLFRHPGERLEESSVISQGSALGMRVAAG